MKKFRRKGDVIVTLLSEAEVELLTSMVQQLVELVADGEPEEFDRPEQVSDPFEQWSKEMGADEPAEDAEPAQDPVLRRLFPDAYADDAEAAADFRRFTERDLKAKKVGEAGVVLAALEATQYGRYDLRIPVDDAGVWLRTLNSLRLAVAIRLGITDASVAEELATIPEDDPRAFMASVYDWLSFAQETLINTL